MTLEEFFVAFQTKAPLVIWRRNWQGRLRVKKTEQCPIEYVAGMGWSYVSEAKQHLKLDRLTLLLIMNAADNTFAADPILTRRLWNLAGVPLDRTTQISNA